MFRAPPVKKAEEEQITRLERLGCAKDCIRYGLGSGGSGQEQRA
jgi:hypothetical protein